MRFALEKRKSFGETRTKFNQDNQEQEGMAAKKLLQFRQGG
jgi:hypothetical protein